MLRRHLEWPVDGLLFDVENNGFWIEDWGDRPEAIIVYGVDLLDYIAGSSAPDRSGVSLDLEATVPFWTDVMVANNDPEATYPGAQPSMNGCRRRFGLSAVGGAECSGVNGSRRIPVSVPAYSLSVKLIRDHLHSVCVTS